MRYILSAAAIITGVLRVQPAQLRAQSKRTWTSPLDDKS